MLALGPDAVVVTGGHADDGADVLVDGGGLAADRGPALSRRRLARLGLHPLLGAGRASSRRGEELADAARWAREIAAEAVGNGLRELGGGAGPVDVFGIARGAIAGAAIIAAR